MVSQLPGAYNNEWRIALSSLTNEKKLSSRLLICGTFRFGEGIKPSNVRSTLAGRPYDCNLSKTNYLT